MDQTQIGATVGTASTSSEGAASNQQDPTQLRPGQNGMVDAGSSEGNRNSGSSDGSGGGDSSDGGRNRPGRAERRISELTSRIKELEAQQSKGSDLSQQLMASRISPSQVQLPDYSQMTEVTPAQIQADIVKAAEQIVDIKMGALATTLDQKVTRKDAAGRALQEIAKAKEQYSVLNENDEEHYNAELDESIGNGYFEIFKNNPNYSFTEYLKSFKPVLDLANTAASDGATRGVGTNRGTGAIRPAASSRRSQKSPYDMSLDELEAYIHSQNGR